MIPVQICLAVSLPMNNIISITDNLFIYNKTAFIQIPNQNIVLNETSHKQKKGNKTTQLH